MMAPGVAAKVFSLKTAVIVGAIFSIIGASLLGHAVAKTLDKGLIIEGYNLDDIMVCAILVSMILVLVIASALEGLPLSTTQAIVGAVVGIAIANWIADGKLRDFVQCICWLDTKSSHWILRSSYDSFLDTKIRRITGFSHGY
ncbi:MAG: inorganic phosphate transporter [Candidatus Hodarchaeales archaeon]